MSCEGCAKAVRAILSKTEGVQGVDIDVPTQKVVVTGDASSGAFLSFAHPISPWHDQSLRRPPVGANQEDWKEDGTRLSHCIIHQRQATLYLHR